MSGRAKREKKRRKFEQRVLKAHEDFGNSLRFWSLIARSTGNEELQAACAVLHERGNIPTIEQKLAELERKQR